MMKKEIESFMDSLKSHKKLSTFDEASTKQAVVMRLLSFLGWDIFNVDEVYPDYSSNSHTVSYALRAKNTSKVYIEVKKAREKLDNYQKQIVTAASRDGVELAVLTNGILWWFFLPQTKGDWQQKWFFSADLLKQKPDAVSTHFIDLLNKNKVLKGQSTKTAKIFFRNKKHKIASSIIPQAWNQIISQPNKIFVELLVETTEKFCGFKVESELIQKFLRKNLETWRMKEASNSIASPPSKIPATLIINEETEFELPVPAPKTPEKRTQSYADKELKNFSFNGSTYQVRAWDDMLTTMCDYFASNHTKDFEKVLWLSNDRKSYFSRYKDHLSIPEKIKGTDIYVETKLKPDEIVKTTDMLVAEFGYNPEDIVLTTK
jgi:predicted type IV restriction endonuclease